MCKQAEEQSLDTLNDMENLNGDLGSAHQAQKLPLPSPEASPSQNTGKTSSAGQDTCMGAIESLDMPGVSGRSHATVLCLHHSSACTSSRLSSNMACQTAAVC